MEKHFGVKRPILNKKSLDQIRATHYRWPSYFQKTKRKIEDTNTTHRNQGVPPSEAEEKWSPTPEMLESDRHFLGSGSKRIRFKSREDSTHGEALLTSLLDRHSNEEGGALRVCAIDPQAESSSLADRESQSASLSLAHNEVALPRYEANTRGLLPRQPIDIVLAEAISVVQAEPLTSHMQCLMFALQRNKQQMSMIDVIRDCSRCSREEQSISADAYHEHFDDSAVASDSSSRGQSPVASHTGRPNSHAAFYLLVFMVAVKRDVKVALKKFFELLRPTMNLALLDLQSQPSHDLYAHCCVLCNIPEDDEPITHDDFYTNAVLADIPKLPKDRLESLGRSLLAANLTGSVLQAEQRCGQLHDIEAQIQSATMTLSAFNSSIAMKQKELRDMTDELSTLASSIESEQKHLKELNTKIARNTLDASASNMVVEQHERLTESVRELQQQRAAIDQEVTTSRQEHEKLIESVRELKLYKDKIDEEVRTSWQEHARWARELWLQNDEAHRALAALRQEHGQWMESIRVLRLQNFDINQEIAKGRKTLVHVKAKSKQAS